MELKVKRDIIKMLIPIVGIWWLLERLLAFSHVNWWDYSKYSIPLTFALVFYQIICLVGYKILYMMYFFDYTFIEVFIKK